VARQLILLLRRGRAFGADLGSTRERLSIRISEVHAGRMDQLAQSTFCLSKDEVNVTDLGDDGVGWRAETIDDEIYLFLDEE